MIENAVVTVNWKGELVLKIDPLGMISKTKKEINEHSNLMEFRARWNVIGKLIYKFDKKGIGRNGKQWHRKGIMIMDSSGSMKISGWANDWGTQYRSGIYYSTESQKAAAVASQQRYQAALTQAGYGEITTEICDVPPFFFAEDYHQQYLGKNPNGYCGMGGTGVSCPIGLST